MFFDNIIGPAKDVGWVLRFWPVLAASFVGSMGSTWLCKKIALKFGIVDRPDDLVKTHKEPIAYLGGIGMLVGLTVGVLAGIGVLKDEVLFSPMLKWLLALLAGGAIACFVGLADDLFDNKTVAEDFGSGCSGSCSAAGGYRSESKIYFRFFGCVVAERTRDISSDCDSDIFCSWSYQFVELT